jgi:glycerol kinase
MLQIQADMIRCNVDRPQNVETTALGAAYLAGLAVGLIKSTDDILTNRRIDTKTVPSMSDDLRKSRIAEWHNAVDRSRAWITK